jgi:dTDP-4-dehydrorhamnose reductase
VRYHRALDVRVLITGGGGLVASALAPRFDEVFALKHAALDITSRQSVDDVVERIRPGLIINTAVIGVDDCERNPALAKSVNAGGPEFLAQAAARVGAAIVHFSSNYVFDGHPSPREPYTVGDEPRPVNVYGRTKLEGERAVLASCPRSIVIRTSWVYGPSKQSFLATVAAKLKRGETVRAISDTWASSTYVADLADRVVEILEREDYGLHHAANEGVCSYETFARETASLLGLPEEIANRLIEVIAEEEMNREAPRPPWTPMRCEPPLRPWQEGLADWVASSQ